MAERTCNSKIKLWVQYKEGNRLECKVDRFQPLVIQLRSKFSLASGRCNSFMRFMHNGQRILGMDTCNSLSLEDDDLIQVDVPRIGFGL